MALARLIDERGLRKGYVARRAGVGQSTLSRILSGAQTFGDVTAVKLARALDLPLDYFLPEN